MALPPKYHGTTTRELEDELTHAFQLMGLNDAPGVIETLRNIPTDFLADERPCVQRLAALYQSMVPPRRPRTESSDSKLWENKSCPDSKL